MGFLGSSVAKNLPLQEMWVDLWVKKSPWRRKWQPTLVFLLGKSPEQRNLASAVHGVPKESDTT